MLIKSLQTVFTAALVLIAGVTALSGAELAAAAAPAKPESLRPAAVRSLKTPQKFVRAHRKTAKIRARAAGVRYGDGRTISAGFICDAGYRMLSAQSYSDLPAGYAFFRAVVYDRNAGGAMVYQTNWIPGNTRPVIIAQRSAYSRMINAAIWVQYARWVSGPGWIYFNEWANSFTQDGVQYSRSCLF